MASYDTAKAGIDASLEKSGLKYFDLSDFELSDAEMEKISALGLGYVGPAVKHFNPDFVRGCLSVKIHD